ncbi:MAG TPA: hypothetical protein VIK86_02095 [Candidatus Paceibacterota bacterium]
MSKSKFDLYVDGKYMGFGNPNMLKTYTDEEIRKFYKRFNTTVIIEREVK